MFTKLIQISEIQYLQGVFAGNLFLVGGCVRDFLIDKNIYDFDFATSLEPQEIIEIAILNKIKYRIQGINFGTVVLFFNGKEYEITTFRHELTYVGRHPIVTYVGRHPIVKYTKSLLIDSQRRDFTINAMYVDSKGNLYDPQNGIQDLQHKHLKFIGDPLLKIQEDPIRILRYFRFLTYLKTNLFDAHTIKILQDNWDLTKKLSPYRLWQELEKLLLLKNPLLALSYLKYPVHKINFKAFKRLIQLELTPDILARSCLMQTANIQPAKLNKQRRLLLQYLKQDEPWRYKLYQSKDLAKSLKTLALSLGYSVNEPTEYPVCPITGADLLQKGLKGEAIGKELKKLLQQWLEKLIL